MQAKTFLWFTLLINLLSVTLVMAAPAPSSEEILSLIGVPQQKISELKHGEVITYDIPESTGKELATSVAIYLPVPIESVVEYFKNGDLLAIDPDIITHGAVSKNASENDFKGFAFSEKQSDEVTDLLNARAGDHFNLSNQEISDFVSTKNVLSNKDKKGLSEAVSEKYREMLLKRFQAYQMKGLAGIITYSRGTGVSDPGSELQLAVENNKVLAQYFPELLHGWIKYPTGLPKDIKEDFYWINRKVENRPTAILGHRIFQETKAGAIIVARQFYVGHSYNSSQLTVGALPYQAGTLVFYGQRTSTDGVTGMASGLKRKIGTEQMKKQMVDRLKSLKNIVRTISKPH